MALTLPNYDSVYSQRGAFQGTGPTLSEQIGAQFKLENVVGSSLVYLQDRPIFGFEEDPDWDPAAYLEEYYKDSSPEDYFRVWSVIHETNSLADATQRLAVDAEFQEARRVRDTMGGWTQLWTGALAGITDPVTLATLAVPVGAGAGALRGAARIGGLVTGETLAIEGALHWQQKDRTLKESVFNVTANAILGGVVGGAVGKMQANRLDRVAASSAIRKTLDSEAIEIDDINVEIGATYETIDELNEALARSDLSGVSAIRASGSDHFNATIRGATNKYSMKVREVMQQLASNSFLTRASKEGDVGTASMSGASTAIETATNRFSGRQHRILLDGLKEWRLTKPLSENVKNKVVKGWDDFLEEVGVGFRKYDQETKTIDGADIPEWQKKMYDDLIGIQKEYQSLLSRKGMIDELVYVHTKRNGEQVERKVIDEERTTASLEKSEQQLEKVKEKIMRVAQDEAEKIKLKEEGRWENVRKTKKWQEANKRAAKLDGLNKRFQRINDDIELKKSWLDKIKRYKNGDQKAADEIFEEMHGEKRYLTQSHNKTAMIADKEGWMNTAAAAEKSWYMNQSAKNGGSSTAAGRKALRDWSQLSRDPVKYRERLEGIYKEIIDNRDPLALGGMDNNVGAGPAMLKARKLRVDQTMMGNFLKNNFLDLQNAHYSSVLPSLELKSRGLDPAGLRQVEAQIRAEYDLQKQAAKGDIKKINALEVDLAKSLEDIKSAVDIIRNEQYQNVTQLTRDIAFTISQYNATRHLGAMLLPSTGDLAGVIAKTGLMNIIRAIKPTLKGFNDLANNATKKELREMVGIIELVSASRVHALNTSAELGVNQASWARWAGRTSKAFYKATGILWWNQGVKEMAILGFSDGILKADPARMSKKQMAWFARDGIDADKLAQIHDLFRRYPVENEHGSAVINTGKIYEEFASSRGGNPQIVADAKLADEWNALLTKHANRTVVTPETADLPRFITRHPFLKLIGQYKGFGSASINKTMIPMMQGIAMGDAHMAFGFLGLTSMGTFTYMARQKLYDREITQNWETLAYEGILRGGALGLYSDGIAISQNLTDNWFGMGDKLGIQGASKYYARSVIGDIAGPTVGMIEDLGATTNMISRWMQGEELSDSDRARGVRMIPFNNLFYLRYLIENWDNF